MANRSSPFLALAVLLLAAQPSVQAQSAAVSSRTYSEAALRDLDPAKLLPPPPVRGSAEERREVDAVRAIVAQASPAQKARATADDRDETPDIFDAAIGPTFHARQLPATWALLTAVQRAEEQAATRAKKMFGRTRPWGVDTTLVPCDAAPGKKPTNSYPSGHAMLGYSVGLVLAEVIPDRAPQILTRAQDYAVERVICGAHFPSDVEASHALASIVVTRLQVTPEYAAQLEAARNELRRAGLIVR